LSQRNSENNSNGATHLQTVERWSLWFHRLTLLWKFRNALSRNTT